MKKVLVLLAIVLGFTINAQEMYFESNNLMEKDTVTGETIKLGRVFVSNLGSISFFKNGVIPVMKMKKVKNFMDSKTDEILDMAFYNEENTPKELITHLEEKTKIPKKEQEVLGMNEYYKLVGIPVNPQEYEQALKITQKLVRNRKYERVSNGLLITSLVAQPVGILLAGSDNANTRIIGIAINNWGAGIEGSILIFGNIPAWILHKKARDNFNAYFESNPHLDASYFVRKVRRQKHISPSRIVKRK